MAKTVTAAEMKARERAANEAGLLYIQMMENAGRAAWKALKARVPALKRLLVVAGKGNNGGDGFVIARVAAKEGVQVRVLLAEGEPKTPDAQTNLALLAETAAEATATRLRFCGILPRRRTWEPGPSTSSMSTRRRSRMHSV